MNNQGELIVKSLQSLSKVKSSSQNEIANSNNEYKLTHLIFDVLTPALQKSLSNYIKINFKQNVDEYLKEKWHIIEKNDHLRKVKRLIIDYQSISINNNTLKFPNDFKLFSINDCCSFVRNILVGLKCDWKKENLNDYSQTDLENIDLGDVFNCAKLLKRHCSNRTNEFPVDDAFFNNFMTYLNGLLQHLNINNELKETKTKILNTKIKLVNERFDEISLINAGQLSTIFRVKDLKFQKIR